MLQHPTLVLLYKLLPDLRSDYIKGVSKAELQELAKELQIKSKTNTRVELEHSILHYLQNYKPQTQDNNNSNNKTSGNNTNNNNVNNNINTNINNNNTTNNNNSNNNDSNNNTNNLNNTTTSNAKDTPKVRYQRSLQALRAENTRLHNANTQLQQQVMNLQQQLANNAPRYRDVVAMLKRQQNPRLWKAVIGEFEPVFTKLYGELEEKIEEAMGKEGVPGRSGARIMDNENLFAAGLCWIKSNCNNEIVELLWELTHRTAWAVCSTLLNISNTTTVHTAYSVDHCKTFEGNLLAYS